MLIDQELERRAMIENADPSRFDALTHQTHVLGALQAAPCRLASTIDREGIAPVAEPPYVLVGAVEHAVHPGSLREEATQGFTTGSCVFAPTRLRRHVPDAYPGRCRSAARPAIALIGQHHPSARARRRPRRPGSRWAAADHQHVRVELDRSTGRSCRALEPLLRDSFCAHLLPSCLAREHTHPAARSELSS